MDKKNTLLLTVIAIATLLVAVVGATFAYFSAQTGVGNSANVEVKTQTTDTLTFGAFTPLYIIATQQNFGNVSGGSIPADTKIGSQKAISTGKIEYQKGGDGSKDYCYTATLKITNNNFTYADSDDIYGEDQDGRNHDKFKNKKAPELLLKIKKESQTNSNEVTTIEYTEPLNTDGKAVCSSSDSAAVDNCVYYEHLTGHRRVCTQDNSSKTSIDDDSNIKYTGNCLDDQTIEGLDITILQNKEIKIPNAKSGNSFEHKLTATSEKDKVTDTWTAELVFVDYDWDQKYNASTAEQIKKFNATWEFKKLDSCS